MHNFAECGFAPLTNSNPSCWPDYVHCLVGIVGKVVDNLVMLEDALIVSKVEGKISAISNQKRGYGKVINKNIKKNKKM